MQTTVHQDKDFTGMIRDTLEIERMDATPFVEWVGNNFLPGEVFAESDLAQWAIDNGFVREEGA